MTTRVARRDGRYAALVGKGFSGFLAGTQRSGYDFSVGAGPRVISAKPSVNQQAQLIEAACIQPSLDGAERSIDQDRDRDRGTRNLHQRVQLERHRLLAEINLSDSGER